VVIFTGNKSIRHVRQDIMRAGPRTVKSLIKGRTHPGNLVYEVMIQRG